MRLTTSSCTRRLVADPNPFPEPTDVAELTLDSSTKTAIGFNVGLLAMPTENFSIGLSYRHEVTLDHEAQANFVQILTGNTALDQAVAIALPGSQPATVSFTYPGSFAVGVALRRGYWTFEADFQWMLWSSFDQVDDHVPNAPGVQHEPARELDEHLARRDRRRVPDQGRLGGARAATATTTARRPTETISPFIHDADRHTFGLGGTWKYEKLRLDFNLRYVLFRDSSTLGHQPLRLRRRLQLPQPPVRRGDRV